MADETINLLEKRRHQVYEGGEFAMQAEKQSLAGSVSQRSCSFCGSRVVLYPIADAIHVVHGPIGCASYTWDIRGALSSGPELHRLSFSTDMMEKDVIYGGETKLYHALIELIDEYEPKAAFVYSTCIVGVIGDDVVTRSGTLGYEAASQMKELGIGVSTSVGIGGDPINGSSFLDMLELFERDPETEAVMMIGEIGGPQEAEAALWAKENMKKPVIGYVAGLTAPKGRRMGHAGAIISAFGDTAAEKAEIMRSLGLTVARSPAELGAAVAEALAKAPQKRKRGAR